MSLINNYLRKTQLGPRDCPAMADVPPLLKSYSAKSGRSVWQQVGLVMLGVVLAGGGLVYLQARRSGTEVVFQEARSARDRDISIRRHSDSPGTVPAPNGTGITPQPEPAPVYMTRMEAPPPRRPG